ncbi:hypothetical protein MKN84_01165 [Streptococcus suis]|nr:hypothetical protein [Streptococcus suis]
MSELVERADIGRVTVYRNFYNKEEELKRSFNTELQAWLSEGQIDLSDWTDGQLLSALRQFFDFWYEQQDKIRFLICLTVILIALVAK